MRRRQQTLSATRIRAMTNTELFAARHRSVTDTTLRLIWSEVDRRAKAMRKPTPTTITTQRKDTTMLRIPMPSPRGTNHEGLYLTGRVAEIVARERASPTIAYDSRHGLHGLAYDDYTPPQDDVAKALVGLLDLLKRSMKSDDYKAAEIAVGNIMKLSRERLEDHHAQLNEANSNSTTNAGPPKSPGAPRPPVAQDSVAALRARLYATDRSVADVRKNLRAHMARIQQW